ncbi:MAG: hypothetical protein AAFR16_08575, partial [Pseudomonadota bacterium]
MRRALNPAPLAAARPPLERVIRRGWIWRGTAPLDGLLVAKSESWRARLAPRLEHAAALLETEDLALMLFGEPVELDCEALGGALPLRRVEGALAGLPIAPPKDPDLRHWVSNRVLWMAGGALLDRPLSDFAPAPLDPWLALDAVEIEPGAPPPTLPEATTAPALAVEPSAVVDRDFA